MKSLGKVRSQTGKYFVFFELGNISRFVWRRQTRKAHRFESTAGQRFNEPLFKLAYKCSQRMIRCIAKYDLLAGGAEAHTFCNLTLRNEL